ncbi:unnamed protein product [Phytophthora lilii]|uniref:Unnamed protein product n=1 Tax=Phytophthora lilii TaxID=2077276 RepID=A0A9W6YM03_9STRA|nr:unnamed protein product [Phytophthora lilii]
MARKVFQLVGEDGKALTSVDAVVVDIEDVFALRDAVKEKYCDSHLAGIAASDLTVFDANGVALDPRDSLADIDEKVTLIVQVPMQEQKVEVEVTEERPESQPHPNRLKRWAYLNEVLDRNKKAKLNYDGESSTGYSHVSYYDVEKNLRATSYEQQSKDIPGDDIDVVYAYLLRVSKVFGAIVTGKDAKRLHFIAPILVCVSWLFHGDVQILVEESVEGKRLHGHGFFEFVIQRGMKRVCVVAAKKDDFQAGIAQNLVGCEALADNEGLKKVFGIVTNYKEWLFFRSLDERIERDEAEMKTTHGTPTRESVKEIAEKIYFMLSEDD